MAGKKAVELPQPGAAHRHAFHPLLGDRAGREGTSGSHLYTGEGRESENRESEAPALNRWLKGQSSVAISLAISPIPQSHRQGMCACIAGCDLLSLFPPAIP